MLDLLAREFAAEIALGGGAAASAGRQAEAAAGHNDLPR